MSLGNGKLNSLSYPWTQTRDELFPQIDEKRMMSITSEEMDIWYHQKRVLLGKRVPGYHQG